MFIILTYANILHTDSACTIVSTRIVSSFHVGISNRDEDLCGCWWILEARAASPMLARGGGAIIRSGVVALIRLGAILFLCSHSSLQWSILRYFGSMLDFDWDGNCPGSWNYDYLPTKTPRWNGVLSIFLLVSVRCWLEESFHMTKGLQILLDAACGHETIHDTELFHVYSFLSSPSSHILV